ncbi:MAG: 4-hydroxy-tetrahydrodipicolinate synthase [Clostridia bacterium]
MTKLFTGCATALVTPFKGGEIDYESVDKLIQIQLENEVDALVICATTGESTALSTYEKNILLSYVIQKVDGKCKVIFGISSSSTKSAGELAEDAEDIGADALLISAPPYTKPSQEGIYLHYKEISSRVNIPVIIYNVPSRAGVNIEPETVLRLSKISNILGLKEASTDIAHILKVFSLVSKDFCIYSGNDNLTYTFLTLGGRGVISVLSNILPFEVKTMCQAYFSGNIERAKKLQFEYLNLVNALFIESNPVPIKEAMAELSYISSDVRLPLTNLSEENKLILLENLRSVL